MEYVIIINRDDDAKVWIAQNSEIPIILEDSTLEVLIERVKSAASEITAMNNLEKPSQLCFVIQAIIKETIS